MRIGETLIDQGIIGPEQLELALQEQGKTHERLGDIIIKQGFATSEDIAPILAEYFQIPHIKLKDLYRNLQPEVVDIISSDLAHRFQVIPIEIKDKTLFLATFDPLDLLAIDTIKIRTGYKVRCVMAAESEIKEAIEYCYQHLPRMKEHIDNFIDSEADLRETQETDSANVQYEADDQPVVQFVKSLIIQAVNKRASDILLQPKQEKSDLRFRVDGVLYNVDPPPKAMLAAINTRIKILAGLDIAEKRLPQDGRFKMQFGEREVDIRASVFPTIYGESVVMRILDTSAPLLGIEQLGLRPDELVKYRELLQCSYGLILVTGPTGSGKTTTLYTSLNEIKSSEKNIVTLEDPVEYRLPFIQQSQINTDIGFDFARGLRSLLRQDPDVIMVGEIRDQETAEIAIHAALTGHLVFATLHTNDAAGAPVRLMKMGVEPFLITSSLRAVIAQRLIRTICKECVELSKDNGDLLTKFNLDPIFTKLYKGRGCAKCMQSGYKGRKGIYEMLVPNEEIGRLILEQRSSEVIRTAAQDAGMKTLRQMGIEDLKRGQTTIEELLRVTQEAEE